MHEEEILDLVDENDIVIGQMERSAIYGAGMSNIRVVNGFVINDNGQLWIPRRASNKSVYPNGLDMSVGGHIGAGEDYETAFKRETAEELNIDLNIVPYKEIAYLNPGDHPGLHCFQKIYEIRMNDTPNYNPDDFSEYYWLYPQEVIGRIEAGDSAKGDLAILIRALYL